MLHESLKITTYIGDGFEKVCDVALDDEGHWYYTNINESIMFDGHTSWLYVIVDDEEIKKLGETGQPLGIRSPREPDQPKTGTKSRLGRYRKHKGERDTDGTIRQALVESVTAGTVSIWAKKCQVIMLPIVIGGVVSEVAYAPHRDLEKRYLARIVENGGRLPILNKGHS